MQALKAEQKEQQMIALLEQQQTILTRLEKLERRMTRDIDKLHQESVSQQKLFLPVRLCFNTDGTSLLHRM